MDTGNNSKRHGRHRLHGHNRDAYDVAALYYREVGMILPKTDYHRMAAVAARATQEVR